MRKAQLTQRGGVDYGDTGAREKKKKKWHFGSCMGRVLWTSRVKKKKAGDEDGVKACTVTGHGARREGSPTVAR